MRHTSGILCAPLTAERAKALNLEPMVRDNNAPLRTAFTVSVDYREGLTTQQLEHILETYAQLKYGDRRLRTQIAAGRCMLIPTDEALPWFHSPPCRQGDIGEIMPGGHIAFRAVTNGQLEYAIALFIHGWSGLPIRMEQFPEYREASHP